MNENQLPTPVRLGAEVFRTRAALLKSLRAAKRRVMARAARRRGGSRCIGGRRGREQIENGQPSSPTKGKGRA